MCTLQSCVHSRSVSFHAFHSLALRQLRRCYRLCTKPLPTIASLLHPALKFITLITLHYVLHSLSLVKSTRCLSFVLACEATGCVSGGCWHNPTRIYMPRTRPHCATWHYIASQVAPACGARSFIHYVITSFISLLRRAKDSSDYVFNHLVSSY